MKIFLDFDNVLLNTRYGFRPRFFGALEPYGLSAEQCLKIFQEHFSGKASKKGLLLSIPAFVDIALKDRPEALEAGARRMRETMEDVRDLVFSDVLPFLNRYQKEDLIIVTYGDTEFQRQKIIAADLDKRVSDILFTDRGKIATMEEYILNRKIPRDERIYFIDDSDDYFTPEEENESESDISFIHLIRPEVFPDGVTCNGKHDDAASLEAATIFIQ